MGNMMPTMVLRGPMESCEDIVCSKCGQQVQNNDYSGYKKCKQTCFKDNKDQIISCCLAQCAGLTGREMSECIRNCQSLRYE